MEFFLLLISVPVFYIWGIVSFIKLISGSSRKKGGKFSGNGSRREYLEAAITDLKKNTAGHPDKQVSAVLNEYETELGQILKLAPAAPMQINEPADTTAVIADVTTPAIKHAPASPSLHNWYKDNSINLLLYIGAFLIIVSATIYVSRENVSGVSKGTILTILTAAFYLSGIWFSKMPRIKNAGTAFTAIGALLIPICGLGWYNFVFKAAGINMGVVWMITSLIALISYVFLARYFKSIFYSFITSFSSLSLSFSLVKMQNQQAEFYVLASIITCLILLGVSIYLKEKNTEDNKILGEPMSLTANIVLPFSLFFMLMQSIATTQQTLHTVTSLFLGGMFYVIKYLQTNTAWHIPAAQLLFALTLLYFGLWRDLSHLHILLLLTGIVYIIVYATAMFRKHNKTPECSMSAMMSIILSILIFLGTYMTDITDTARLFFVFSGITVGILLFLITKEMYILALPIAFIGILNKTLLIDMQGYALHILGISYTAFALLWYVLTDMYKQDKKTRQLFGTACVVFFLLSTILIGTNWSYQIANMLLMTIISYLSIYEFGTIEFIYLGNILLGAVLFSILQQMGASIAVYPLAYTTLSIGYYLIGIATQKSKGVLFRNSGMIGAFITTIIYGMYGYNADYLATAETIHNLQQNALIAAYCTTIMFSYESYRTRSSQLGYFASAIGLCTYLWQINFIGITDILPYTYVIGIYFIIIAFFQRHSPDRSRKLILDCIGLFFLILPTWTKALDPDGLQYAVALGMIGIGLLVFSITYNDKLYRYAAIGAIVLAVMSQSRWAIIGMAGIGFLAFALYLLIFRKEDKDPPK